MGYGWAGKEAGHTDTFALYPEFSKKGYSAKVLANAIGSLPCAPQVPFFIDNKVLLHILSVY